MAVDLDAGRRGVKRSVDLRGGMGGSRQAVELQLAPKVKRPAGELTIDRLSRDRIILGDPASCLAQIRRFQETLGLTHLICRMSVAGVAREAAMASLDLFTRDVLPGLGP